MIFTLFFYFNLIFCVRIDTITNRIYSEPSPSSLTNVNYRAIYSINFCGINLLEDISSFWILKYNLTQEGILVPYEIYNTIINSLQFLIKEDNYIFETKYLEYLPSISFKTSELSDEEILINLFYLSQPIDEDDTHRRLKIYPGGYLSNLPIDNPIVIGTDIRRTLSINAEIRFLFINTYDYSNDLTYCSPINKIEIIECSSYLFFTANKNNKCVIV